MEDILLIDKPKGITSFDVIRILRRTRAIKKAGHAGTLDPLASGLMIIGVENGTKKLNEYIKLDKTYEVEMILGESRTTGDMEGEVIASKKVDIINNEKLQKVLDSLKGDIELSVPKYSAIKIDGKRLYNMARDGKDFTPPAKVMHIENISLVSIQKIGDTYEYKLVMDVGSGAYVRSIVEEIGRQLGYPAVTKELRRTRIGDFTIEEAKKLEGVKEFLEIKKNKKSAP